MSAAPVRVALLEDVPLLRRAIEETLEADPAFAVCAVASTCLQARTVFRASRPDVVLLDLFLPDGNGFDVGLELRRTLDDVRIIILSEHVQPEVLAFLDDSERPYWSYLLKTQIASSIDLIEATQSSRRRPTIDPAVQDRPLSAEALRLELLTDRQREILALVAAGMSNTAIAGQLHLTPKAVEYHLTQIYAQLQVGTESSANPRVKATLLYLRPGEH